ncbi:MAG: hypothetical protein ACU0BB_16480 [Paracoccaceae bacterium]|jgi:hypothetical protein
MIRKLCFALMTFGVLSACGVDGEPVQPTLNAHVGIGSSGVDVRGGVSASRGPVNIFVGF